MPVAIPLTRGMTALVDEADVGLLGPYKWQIWENGPHRYAVCWWNIGGVRRRVSMHRLIMGEPIGLIVDHIDGNGLNNCRANLRVVQRGQNRSNSIKRATAASLFKGVFRKGLKWGAQISCERLPSSPWYIGTFSTAEDAARAYDAVARVLFGEHARVNFHRIGEHSAIERPPMVPLGETIRRASIISPSPKPLEDRKPHVVTAKTRIALPEEVLTQGPIGAIPIKITGGITWVSPEDVEKTCVHNWKVVQTKPGWSKYARRTTLVPTVSGHLVKALHRLIMDAAPGELFDHVDHDGLNNTRGNLRLVTVSENRINTIRRNRFGFRGVIQGPRDSGFRAKIVVDGKPINLSSFPTPEAAARAYDKAAKDHHGEFAVVNFPDVTTETTT